MPARYEYRRKLAISELRELERGRFGGMAGRCLEPLPPTEEVQTESRRPRSPYGRIPETRALTQVCFVFRGYNDGEGALGEKRFGRGTAPVREDDTENQ